MRGEESTYMTDQPLPELLAGVYEHYKGELYLVIGYARHSETDEVFVTYVPLYTHTDGVQLTGPRLCVRPASLFFGDVLTTCPICGRSNMPGAAVIVKPGDAYTHYCYCSVCRHDYQAELVQRFRYIGAQL